MRASYLLLVDLLELYRCHGISFYKKAWHTWLGVDVLG